MRSFYYISGPDGSGKTTHAMVLLDKLHSRHIDAKYVWCRSPKFLSKPLLAYCRLVGLTKYWEENGIKVGTHHFYKSKLVSKIYPWLQFFDMMIFKFFKIILPFYIKRKSIIIDRFVYDTLVDLMVDTNRYNMYTENVGKHFLKMMPTGAKVVFLDVDEDTLRKRKRDVSVDPNLKLKRELFLNLAKNLKIMVINTAQQYKIVEKKIQKELGV